MTDTATEMRETRKMLLDQMRKLAKTDASNEDEVRNQAALSQVICNCAKVYNECYEAEAKLLHEKSLATKVLARVGTPQRSLASSNE